MLHQYGLKNSIAEINKNVLRKILIMILQLFMYQKKHGISLLRQWGNFGK